MTPGTSDHFESTFHTTKMPHFLVSTEKFEKPKLLSHNTCAEARPRRPPVVVAFLYLKKCRSELIKMSVPLAKAGKIVIEVGKIAVKSKDLNKDNKEKKKKIVAKPKVKPLIWEDRDIRFDIDAE